MISNYFKLLVFFTFVISVGSVFADSSIDSQSMNSAKPIPRNQKIYSPNYSLPLTRKPADVSSSSRAIAVGTCRDFRGRVHYSTEPSYKDCIEGSDVPNWSTSPAQLFGRSIAVGIPFGK